MKWGAIVLALALGADAFVPHASPVISRTRAVRSKMTMEAATAPATQEALATAATEARGLAMDSIAAAESGHLGLPLGAAEMGAVLFGQSMTYNADEPKWINRDRFVLSAGHGSMFLYSWLHIAGYDLPKAEVANFRQHHAMTPGHPEFPSSEHNTPGIEATTGPLGAGVSNCAGLAAASKMSGALFNTDDHTIFDNHIFCIVGDGCLQEGVSAEAACFSAHEVRSWTVGWGCARDRDSAAVRWGLARDRERVYFIVSRRVRSQVESSDSLSFQKHLTDLPLVVFACARVRRRPTTRSLGRCAWIAGTRERPGRGWTTSLSLSPFQKLDNLIVLYDANDVTLDKMAEFTQSEDVGKRYEAYGWDVITLLDGHDLVAMHSAVEEAKDNNNGKPTLIICKTEIGKGIDEVAGTNAAHGEAGVAYVDEARKKLGLPEEKWYVSPGTYDYFAEHKKGLQTKYKAWEATYGEWQKANPDKAAILQDGIDGKTPSVAELSAAIPEHTGGDVATRIAGADVLQGIAAAVPLYISGSADLHGSTKNYIKGGGDFGSGLGKTYAGRNVYYGIREHAMGCILNGFAYYGLFRVSGATFLVFADYMRATVRIAALSELPVNYIWTHDSIGVGEDGPTHQPVETVSGLRVFPNLDVIRPADPEETAGAFIAGIDKKTGPTALILTRQNVRTLGDYADVKTRREGVLKGAYILKKETGPLTTIIMGTGSEVQHACAAADAIGDGVRVVSMPCMERFDAQSAEYKAEVLPDSCRSRVAVEAGITTLWYKYVGLDGKVIGVDRFGFSAPGDIVMHELGMTGDRVTETVKAFLA